MAKTTDDYNPFEILNRTLKVARVLRVLDAPRFKNARDEIRDHGLDEDGWNAIASICDVKPLSEQTRIVVRAKLMQQD